MDQIARLRSEQQALCAIGHRLLALVERPEPGDAPALSAVRWELARQLLRHLPIKDRFLYKRLLRHPDPAVVARARTYYAAALALYMRFDQHGARWTAEAVVRDWPAYRAAVRQMVAMLDERVAREEAELFPHLEEVPPMQATRMPDDRNWAADGWKLRQRLGIG